MTVTRAPIGNVALAAYSITETANACLKREVLNYDEKRIWCETFYYDDPARFEVVVYCGLSPENHHERSYIGLWEFRKESDKKGLIEELTRASFKNLGYLRKE